MHHLEQYSWIFWRKGDQEAYKDVHLGPAVCHIFTSGGSAIVHGDLGQPPFGGDFRTKLMGLSICEGGQAVQLFMDHLAPTLFKVNEATEALYLQLIDNQVTLLNEGAARV